MKIKAGTAISIGLVTAPYIEIGIRNSFSGGIKRIAKTTPVTPKQKVIGIPIAISIKTTPKRRMVEKRGLGSGNTLFILFYKMFFL
jgi:hypothetical protein